MRNEGSRSTKRLSGSGDSGMSAYFNSKDKKLSAANPKNKYMPEDTAEEKAKAQSDRIATRGRSDKLMSDYKLPSSSSMPNVQNNASVQEGGPRYKAPTPVRAPVAKDVMSDKKTGANYDMDKMRAAKADWEATHPAPGMKKGGVVKSSASRGDGIAQRGKTRGRIC